MHAATMIPAPSRHAPSRPVRRLPQATALLGLLAAGACGPARAQQEDGPSVTPYRPSVSTPAALSAPGYLELEAGGQHDTGSASERRDSLPYTLKLAFTPDWGVRIGGDAWLRAADARGRRHGTGGDTAIVLKHRFGAGDTSAFGAGDASASGAGAGSASDTSEGSAFGLEAGVNLPTAGRGLGSGKADYGLNGIYSRDFASGAYHLDLNLSATRVGAVEAGASRLQSGWAAALSHALDERWGVVGEVSGTHQRGGGDQGQVLFAASYGASRSLSLDAGFARNLHAGGPNWSLFTGLTVLCGRLF